MFGEQFYPTPLELAKKCMAPHIDRYASYRNGTKILDPSAGSGAFLDAAIAVFKDRHDEAYSLYLKRVEDYKKEKGGYPNLWSAPTWEEHKVKDCCYAIEIDPDLQSVLMGKKYKVIDFDFLKHKSVNHYSLVVMNPPFRNGAKHLLYAWENLSFDNLVCILNAETIKNPCNAERELLAKIIQDNNFTVEFEEGAFSDADRKTDVEIAIVRMKKERQSNLFDDIEVERAKGMQDDLSSVDSINALAKPDIIGMLLEQYTETMTEYVEWRKSSRRMQAKAKLWDWNRDKSYRANDMPGNIDGHGSTDAAQYDNYIERLTEAAWNTVFRLTNMEGKMTKKVKEQFEKNRTQIGEMAFTEENIYTVLNLLIANSERMAVDCCMEVFDFFTAYYKENRVHFEGWKTNDAFEVNAKVILPHIITRADGGTFEVAYRSWDRCDDIDRAMSFIAGKSYDNVLTIRGAMAQHANQCKERIASPKDEFESEFFRIRCFIKGTIHLVFKDEVIHQRFNRIVAKERGWLKAWQGKHAGKYDLVEI